MGDDSTTAEHTAARDMIDTFGSVGTTRCDMTLTTAAGEKDSFRRGVSLSDLARALPGMLDAATITKHNVIVRPHSPSIVFVQLDDLKTDRLTALAPAVFRACPKFFRARFVTELHSAEPVSTQLLVEI